MFQMYCSLQCASAYALGSGNPIDRRVSAMPECPALLTSIARDQTAPFAARAPAFGSSMAAALACTHYAVCNYSVRVPGC